MSILRPAIAILATLLQAVMLAALFDVFHLGLQAAISPFAFILIALTMLLMIGSAFLGNKSSGSNTDTAQISQLEDGQNKLSGRLNTMQTALDGLQAQLADQKTRVDELMAADRNTLLEENASLKDKLAAVEKEELKRATEAASELRQRNEDLERQIKQWAVETVGQAISRNDENQPNPDNAEAA
jgi:maltodextrin utilization protein YvdJ